MKGFMAFLTLVAVGIMVWREYKPAPKEPELPPPPAILSEPAPVMPPEEQKKVLKSAEDLDPDVRWEAALLLHKFKSADTLPVLFKLLDKDMEPAVRIRVATLLGERKDIEVINALLRATKDPEPEVRLAALGALDQIGNYEVASHLMNGPVKDPDERVRLKALKVINSLQDKRQKEIEAARIKYEQEKKAALEKAGKR